MDDDDLRVGAGPSTGDADGDRRALHAGTTRAELDGGAAAAAAVSAIWVRHRPDILAQVGAVEDAVEAGVAGRPDRERRERAARAAHKLAGSCGSFGFQLAGEIAGRLDEALSGSGRPSTQQYLELGDLVDALRRALEVPPSAV